MFSKMGLTDFMTFAVWKVLIVMYETMTARNV